AVDEVARATPGKTALALEAFSKALTAIPHTISDNGGFDAEELVAQLRAAHYKGESDAGIDMEQGVIGNARELGITESFKCKCHVLMAASEAAEQILRIDSILTAHQRERGNGAQYEDY
ncbi:chaperonin Cpn60/TCP-1 family, partial [Kipferlia bialata]